MLTCPVFKVNWKLQQLNPFKMTKGTDPSVKMWITASGKEPRPDEVLTKGGRNTEWVVEEGSYIS